ncbi:MAG: putative anion-transporting ATPase [Frankiales bacterium]|nr:putative anion-transporting ATPase [Frankiales bacterium]
MMTALDIDDLLCTRRVIVCCGSGGVGKTTTAAALALRAAELGRRTVVLTIDPARRLADAMGLKELDNVPRRVAGIGGASGGSLDALMLDMKGTFDDIVRRTTDPQRAVLILENPFYQSLSGHFAGTQEYMAMEKLGELDESRRWDLIVVDTPPSRSALDFLDAPQRLASFLDGRLARILGGTAKAGGRVGKVALGVMGSAASRVLGTQLFADLSRFVTALEATFGGFRVRAESTYARLQRDDASFVVVATPEPDALREASFFAGRLADRRMPLAGLVLNRVHEVDVEMAPDRADAAAESVARLDPDVSALLHEYAAALRLRARERRLLARFVSAHTPVAVREVAALPDDVHDLDGLRRIGELLGGPPAR